MFRINFTKKIKSAFSIAEILIVLLIVGVMAGLLTASLNPDKLQSKYLYKAALNQIELVVKNIITSENGFNNGLIETALDAKLKSPPEGSNPVQIICNLDPEEDAIRYYPDTANPSSLDSSICSKSYNPSTERTCNSFPPSDCTDSDRKWLIGKICEYSNVIGDCGINATPLVHFTNGVLIARIENFSAPEGSVISDYESELETEISKLDPTNTSITPFLDSTNNLIIKNYALSDKRKEFTRLTVILDGETIEDKWKYGQNAFYIDVYRNGEVHPGGFAADDSKLISYNVKDNNRQNLISGLSFNEARCYAGFPPALSDAGKIQSCIRKTVGSVRGLDTEQTLFDCHIGRVNLHIAACNKLNPGQLNNPKQNFTNNTQNAVCKGTNFKNTGINTDNCETCWNHGGCYIEQTGS